MLRYPRKGDFYYPRCLRQTVEPIYRTIVEYAQDPKAMKRGRFSMDSRGPQSIRGSRPNHRGCGTPFVEGPDDEHTFSRQGTFNHVKG